MDPIKILKRSWQILWSYRTLWVFGLILALAGVGMSNHPGNNSSYQYGGNRNYNPNGQAVTLPHSFSEGMDLMRQLIDKGAQAVGISQQEVNSLIWLGIAALVLFVLTGIGIAIARYVAETAVIKMVDEYEVSGNKLTVRQGFRLGWSRTSWRLFLINLIVHLPAFIFLAILLGAGIAIYRLVTVGAEPVSTVSIIGLIGVIFLSIFITIILGIFLRLLRHFFWRACALEDLNVSNSLARGWVMFRESWKNIGLMWLIMIGLGIVWMLVSVLLAIVTIPIIAITAVLGAVVAAIPGLVLAGIFSTFLGGYLPWIVAVVFVLPLFLVTAFSPWTLLGAWEAIFTSTVWTLTWRELKVIPQKTIAPQVAPAAD